MQQDSLAFAKLKLEELLTFFGINAQAKAEEIDGIIELKVDADSASGRLIGYHGENLRALQYLLNQILQNYTHDRVYATVDISDYKKARGEQIAARVNKMAEKVLETGKDKIMKPMNAAERRLVHMALAEVKGITTESTGEEPRRRVVIKKAS